MKRPQVERFAELRRSASVADPHVLGGPREQVLWTLAITDDDPSMAYLTPAEISDILCDAEGIRVSRQLVASILKSERKAVARRRTKGRDRYRIMRAGREELVSATPFTAMMIDPERALSSTRKVEDLLAGLTGTLMVCDPYVDKKTIDFLAECRAGTAIQLLTVNLQGETAFRRDLASYRREHSIPLTVKVAPAGRLHDRYVIHDAGMLLLGASLNGLGKKQSFVVALGPDLKDVTSRAFSELWDALPELT